MELENVIEELARPLLRYCTGRTGCADLAEDIAQEALRILVERWQLYGPPKDPAAFAFVVARRRAARLHAKHRLQRPLSLLLNRASEAPNPADQAIRRSEVRTAFAVLKKLSPRDREILLLIAAGDLELKQVAEILGISSSAAKMRLHRARRRLTEQMEMGYEPA